MQFHDAYLTSGGSMEELPWLASTYKFDNPGPIVGYPANSALFRDDTCPGILPGNVQLLIPWHPGQLRRTVVFFQALAHEYAKHAMRLMSEQEALRLEIDGKLAVIDAIGSAAITATLIGGEAARGFDLDTPLRLRESSTALARYVIADRAPALLGPLSQAISPPVPLSRLSVGFVSRHTLGVGNPSFWASVFVAISERNMDAWLYGPAAIEYSAKMKIKQEFDRDIARLTDKARDAAQQLSQSFYSHRV